MTIYNFFVKLTHPAKRRGWVETTAFFTGETRPVYTGRLRGTYPKKVPKSLAGEYKEYAIKFYVEDKERIGWYLFYPAPDPDPEGIKGEAMKIRYMKKRPWIFENIE